jgi:Fuc2NAc and GlcNAc transferase
VTLFSWAIGACLMTFGVSHLVTRYGAKVGLVDAPNGRSSHTEETPRAGGIGIVVAGVAAAIAFGLPLVAWLPMSGIAALGLVDDRWHVEPRMRLLAQCTLAGASAGWLSTQIGPSVIFAGAMAIVFVVLLISATNIFNFMDGANGLAGLMGVVAFGTIGMLGFTIAEDVKVGRVALIIAAACCGFLPLNFRRRARVFMGDVCSTFLGFTAAVLALRLWIEQPIWGLCSVASITVFCVDAGWTLLVRLYRHERLLEAHRMHAYQRLVNELGWPHTMVALTYAGIQSTISILLVVSSRRGYGAVVGVLAGVVTVLSLLYWYVQTKAMRRT